MQAHHNKEVVRDITSAAQLESELVLSQAQHGVAVLDVYNAEWGSCKVLGETFRRLFTDAGDAVHLRFFSAECNAIMESLRTPEESRAAPRTRGMACAPDTQSANWGPILESRRRHSKPYFIFYKEGKMRGHLEGIDTPKICKLVEELCCPQNPATDYLTNADAMRFWEVHFSLAESEVPARTLMEALQKDAALHDVRPLLPDDVLTLTEAIGTTSDGNITAADFQAWVGDARSVSEHTAECIAAAAAAAPMRSVSPPELAHEETAEMDVRGQGEGEDAGYPTEEEEGVWEESGDLEASPREAQASEEAAPQHSSEEAPHLAEDTDADADAAGLPEETPLAPTPAEDSGDAVVEEAAATDASDVAGDVPQDGMTSPEKEEEYRELGDPVSTGAAAASFDEEEQPADTGVDTTTTSAGVHQIFTDRWVTVTEDEMRVWNLIAALPLHYPASTTQLLVASDAAAMERAARLVPPVADDFPTLASYLKEQGVSESHINMMCLAAEQKVGSESLSYGKLALILISSDADGTVGLLPEPENLREGLSTGSLVETHPALAFTALCLCASEAYPDEHFFYVPPAGAVPVDVEEGTELTLSALTPLHASTPAPSDSPYYRLIGLPKVIELATTDDCEDTMVLSQWFAKLRVVAVSAEEVTLEFVEVVCADAFAEFAEAYTERLIEDEGRLDKKTDDSGAADAGNGEEDEEELEEGGQEDPVEL